MGSIMRIRITYIMALLLLAGLGQAQNKYVATGEWYWDSDPGTGNGTPITAVDGNFNDAIEAVMESSTNIPALGVHTFNIRVQDPNGSWGPNFTTVIDSWESTVTAQDFNVSMAEFFWDTDPGEGSGTPMLATDGNFDEAVEAIMANSANIPASLGPHVLYVRAQEDEGVWGPTFATVVDVWANVSTARSSFVKSAEYFFDNDPGPGNATPILAQDGNFNQTIEAIIGGGIPAPVVQGVHVLYIRPMDEEDDWGPTFGIVVNMDTTLGAPPFTTVMTGPDEICDHDLSDDHVYTATQNAGTSFVWTATGGTITAGGGTNEVTVNWDGVGPYSIKVVECDVTAVCDSVEFSINTLMPVTVNATATICAGDSIFLEGAWQTTAGQYTDSYTAANGCDSTIVTTLSVTQVVATCQALNGNCQNGNLGTATVSVSGGSGPYLYLWSNGATTASITDLPNGTYCVLVTDNDGCTDECCVTITNDPGYFANESADLCEGDSLFLEGAWQYGGGQFTDMFTTSGGCDSTVVTTVSMVDTFYTSVNLTIMIGDSAFLAGEWQHLAGLYHDTLTSTITGCDSIIATDLMISPVGIVENDLKLDIYPNPINAGQVITANFSQNLDEVRLEVMDMSGRVVFRQDHFNTDRIQISVDLAMGMYRLRLIAGEREVGQNLMVR